MTRLRLCCCAAGLLFFMGCRSLPHCSPSTASGKTLSKNPELLSRHVIELNASGFLVDQHSEHLRAITNQQGLAEYLQTNIFDAFEKSGKKKLLLFVHGGLNDRKEGMAHFWSDYSEVLAGEYYPVFVVWPSGWKGTYMEHLLWVRQGLKAESPNEKAFSLVTTPLVLLADLGRSLGRLPMIIANNSRTDIETATPVRNREGGAAVQQYQEMVREGYSVAIGDDYSRRSDRFVRVVTYWATLPVKYIIASFIDGFGKGAWDNMQRRTQVAYPGRLNERAVEWTQHLKETKEKNEPAAKAAETKLPMTKQQEKKAQRYAAAGLPLLIEALHYRQTNDPTLEVSLVGHSMGTIILNRIVRDADMDFSNIIYLGAACSAEDFTYAVLPYMEKHRKTQFYSLMLHPVAETGEWYPEFGDVPPRGSLLIWIDNFLANPVTEQERTLGRWANLFRSGSTGEPLIHRFFTEDGGEHLKPRLHFQAFSVGFGHSGELRERRYQWNEHPTPKEIEDRCDNPLSHSELSEMPYWKRQFWWQPLEAGGKVRE
jgi:hypothetical protein